MRHAKEGGEEDARARARAERTGLRATRQVRSGLGDETAIWAREGAGEMAGGGDEEAESVGSETETEAKARACGSSCGNGSVCEESRPVKRCNMAAGAGGVPAEVGAVMGCYKTKVSGAGHDLVDAAQARGSSRRASAGEGVCC